MNALFEGRDWDGLQPYLEGLSNSHFRTAGYVLGERLLPQVAAEDFWAVARRLILWQPKAFTVTIAKAATPRFVAGTLRLEDEGFRALARELEGEGHVIDREKLLLQWLPAVKHPEAAEKLFNVLGVQAPRRRVEFLMQNDSVCAAFVMLRTLRFEEHDREYLVHVCRQLIHRAASQTTGSGERLGFNMASLLRTFFDLPEIRGTFSLQLEPYELSRLDTDYEVFKRAVMKV